MIIGLTGGIASGKSTVSALFASLGAPVSDADQLARSLVQPGTEGLKAIVDNFGSDFLQDDGHLNRKRLREMVFSHPDRRRDLEKLLHPLIRDAMLHEARQHDSASYILFVIPLLYETRQQAMVNRVLLVDCSEKTQLKRLMARDAVGPRQAQDILKSQASREQRQQIADDILVNETEEDRVKLPNQVEELHSWYLELSGRHGG